MTNPTFAEMLTLIEDRSAALRAAAGEAGLTARVPGCPDWSVRDLITHLGEVQRFWAAAVAAGPADGPPDEDQVDRVPGEDLMGWSAGATAELVGALRAAGPDRPCWTWWAESGAPMNASAVARHQVQEAGVHAFDAQEAAGRGEPLPDGVAADGIGEFLTVGMATMGPWPHQPGTVALAADGGPAWVVSLSGDGARAAADAADAAGGAGGAEPDARLRGSASDLVLALYGRQLAGDLAVDGDQELASQLLRWTEND
jgi:uncharacterized protein (TIGR03083 family)